MYSASQILAALKNHGIAVTLTKHIAMGYTLSYSAPLTGPLAKLAHENRDVLISYLAGVDRICPCGCAKPGAVKLSKRSRFKDENGVTGIYMTEHLVCTNYFTTMASAFGGWKVEKVQ